MKLAPILATVLLTGLAPAATVIMRFETTMDTTAFGGTAATPLVVTYSFDSALASGTGPAATPDSYGPLSSMEIKLGDQTISGTAGSGIAISNDTGDGDVYMVRSDFTEGTLFGVKVGSFRFLIADPSASMFSDTSLPASFNFSSTSGFFQQTSFSWDDPFNPDSMHLLAVSEQASVPVGERTPFTLTVAPEPGPLAIFGLAALGGAWIRRRVRS